MSITETSIQNQKEKERKRKAEWYLQNRERLAEKWKNNTVRKMIKRKWYQKNKKISIERAKKWNAKHAEARRLIIVRHLHKKSWKTGWANE